LLQDNVFDLLYWEGAVGKSEICRQQYRGAWGLVDNGYHRWTSTQAPAKVNALISEQRLSDWIESFRKDVECVFGILKGWFRILKTDIHLEGSVPADRIWLTCCALHNWLLEVDGLDTEWEGEYGNDDPDECRRYAPMAIRHLTNPQLSTFGSRDHKTASIENLCVAQNAGDDNIDDDDDLVTDIRTDENGAIFINTLSYADFRERLITHFDILHRNNKIRWPTRRRNTTS